VSNERIVETFHSATSRMAHEAIQCHSPSVGRATVIDADTLDIHGERIRLLAIDAPESRQTCEGQDGAPCSSLADAGIGHVVCLADHLSPSRRNLGLVSDLVAIRT
jgi:endonuclease YncB( thermonuclease family)